MKLFMQTLLDEGITEDEIYVMTHTVTPEGAGRVIVNLIIEYVKNKKVRNQL